MSQNSADCLECRLVGGIGLLAACLYIIGHGKKYQNISRFFSMGLGSGIGLLGILRLFNLPPFKVTPVEKEEPKEDICDQENYIVGKLPSKFH